MTTQTISQGIGNFFVELIRSWREQLIFLQPSELATMGLIILNKALSIYRAMLKFWWIILLFLTLMSYEQSYHAVPVIMFGIYGIFILLLARSSVPLKDYAYLFASKKSVIAFVLIVVVSGLNLFPFLGNGLFATLLGWHKNIIILSPLIRLVVLCKLDAYVSPAAGMRALIRGGKIFLYHYPFFIIVYVCAWYLVYPCIAWPFVWLGSMVSGYIPAAEQMSHFIALMIWIPWYSAAIVYGYTRFTREHMDYYY